MNFSAGVLFAAHHPPSTPIFLDSFARVLFVIIVMQRQEAYSSFALRGIIGRFNSEVLRGLNMPLIIGIRNGIDKGMTESDLDLTNGFGLGVMCMHAGVGRIDDVQEFRMRLLQTNELFAIFEKNSFTSKMTTEFVQKMKDAGWTCNVGTKTKRAFNTDFKNNCADRIINATKDRIARIEEEE